MSANPSSAEDNPRITIRVKGSDGSIQKFNIKKKDRFKKMMERYAAIKNLDLRLISFHFNGNRLQPHDTPKGVEMKDEDTVNAFVIRVF